MLQNEFVDSLAKLFLIIFLLGRLTTDLGNYPVTVVVIVLLHSFLVPFLGRKCICYLSNRKTITMGQLLISSEGLSLVKYAFVASSENISSNGEVSDSVAFKYSCHLCMEVKSSQCIDLYDSMVQMSPARCV